MEVGRGFSFPKSTDNSYADEFSLWRVYPLFAFHGGSAMTRKIFPTLLNQFERRLLVKLSTESRRSQSAVIRHLIFKEVAQQQIRCEPPTRPR